MTRRVRRRRDPRLRGAPRIVLSGGTVFGDVRVRAERLRERLPFLRRG